MSLNRSELKMMAALQMMQQFNIYFFALLFRGSIGPLLHALKLSQPREAEYSSG